MDFNSTGYKLAIVQESAISQTLYDENHIDFIEIAVISCGFSDFQCIIKYMNTF